MRTIGFLIACIGLVATAVSFAHDRSPDLERQTRFGPVVGSDDSDTNGDVDRIGEGLAENESAPT